MPTIDTPTAEGASNVLLSQRSLTSPYRREAINIQGDENPGMAIGFDGDGVLTAISAGPVNVKSFGAKGNGTADDTAAIQAAVDAVETAGGGAVIIPCGTYRTTGTVTLGGFAVVIKGECGGVGAFGPKGSVINYEGTGEAFVIGDRVNEAQYGHGIQDLSIMGTAAGRCGVRVGAILADMNNSIGNVILRNVCIKGFTSSTAVHPTSDGEYTEAVVGGCGMFIHRGISCLVDRCDFKDNWIGVIEACAHRATTYSFHGCYFHNCLNIGLRLCSSVEFVFHECIWENNQSTAVLIKPYASIPPVGPHFCAWPMFLSCYWEHNGVSAPGTWNIETSGLVNYLVVRDANMGSSWDDRGGIRIGDGAIGFRLDNVLLGRGSAVAVSTHDNVIGLIIGLATSVDNYVQGTYALGINTTFIESSVGGRLRLGKTTTSGHMLFTPDNTYDIGQSADNQPRFIYARHAVLTNPDTNQLTVVNSLPGNYFTLEVTSLGVVVHRAYGPAASHQFSQSILCVGDLESFVSTNGLVLKSPNGHRWRFTVNNSGVLSAGADLGT